MHFSKALLLLTAALLFSRAVASDTPAAVALPAAQATFSRFSLPASTRVDGVAVSEISGLAWDAEEQVLYAISDSGALFRFRLHQESGMLHAVVPELAVAMQFPANTKSKSASLDAEGLALRRAPAGLSQGMELLVATEGLPKVWRVDPAGKLLGDLPLPAGLSDAKHYEARNTMLEAVAVHPEHGLLVAPERPLKGESPQDGHRIHAADRHWNIAALDPLDSRLKAMDVLESGHLLVLERSGSGKRLVNTLRLADLDACKNGTPCAVETLLHIDRDGGADNFEGMAYLGHNLVLLASDNRGKKGSDTVFLLVNLSKQVSHAPHK